MLAAGASLHGNPAARVQLRVAQTAQRGPNQNLGPVFFFVFFSSVIVSSDDRGQVRTSWSKEVAAARRAIAGQTVSGA